MAAATISGIRCAAMACAVPEGVEGQETDARAYGAETAAKISAATGVHSRHVVAPGQCTSDLCHAAAERAFELSGWERSSIDALIFITQTPDYLLPATSCTLQHRLGLPTSCAAFDVNLGCSGYTYGLWLASQLLNSGLRRVVLLVGDTVSRIVGAADQSTRPLFGDAGSATLLERAADAAPWSFVLGTDGGGDQHLIVRRGLFRESPLDARPQENPEGRLYMNGAEIFTFTLREVPPLVEAGLAEAGWTKEDVDAVVMHQANEFMLKHLGKRMKLPGDKQPYSLRDFGNTSSASIPLTIAVRLADRCEQETLKLLLVGFGVGYSWGTAAVEWGPMPRPEIVILPASTSPAVGQERAAC